MNNYEPLADKSDFIEVTEWHNGEGIDVCIVRYGKEQMLSLTWEELRAIKKLSKHLLK